MGHSVLNGAGERVILALGESNYEIIRRRNNASGSITVQGDEIVFWPSTVCDGTGTYRWSLTGDSLTFTTLIRDGCPGRSEVLAGQTYGPLR